ncbi:MAG: hypothetical protein IKM04_04285 [Clostridia bacterium]|nr:hypothetical protein [Clostridia bacterium]
MKFKMTVILSLLLLLLSLVLAACGGNGRPSETTAAPSTPAASTAAPSTTTGSEGGTSSNSSATADPTATTAQTDVISLWLEEFAAKRFPADIVDDPEALARIIAEHIKRLVELPQGEMANALYNSSTLIGWSNICYTNGDADITDGSEFMIAVIYRRLANDQNNPTNSLPLDVYGLIAEGELEGWLICQSYYHFDRNDDGSWSFDWYRNYAHMGDTYTKFFTDDPAVEYYRNGVRDEFGNITLPS